MYIKVKSVKKRPFHANQSCINDKNSITLTDPEEVLDIDGLWHEYGANLFGKPVNERALSTCRPEDQDLITEVEQAVGMLKCGKTPGAKTINVFRACLGAQLTICAQK